MLRGRATMLERDPFCQNGDVMAAFRSDREVAADAIPVVALWPLRLSIV